jgi:hypothetical protein
VVEIKHGKGSKIEKLLKGVMEQIKDRKYYEKYGNNEVRLLVVAFGERTELGCKFGSKSENLLSTSLVR